MKMQIIWFRSPLRQQLLPGSSIVQACCYVIFVVLPCLMIGAGTLFHIMAQT
jgi:hypothetical protein